MKSLKFILLTIIISCTKNEIIFETPSLYNVQGDFMKSDSIDLNYSLKEFSNKPFKCLGNLFLGVKNINYPNSYILNKDTEPFTVMLSENNEGIIYSIKYNIFKIYNPKLYYDNLYEKTFIEPNINTVAFNNFLKTDACSQDGKENLKTTYNNFVSAFSKKYGKYNYKTKGYNDSEVLVWLSNGIKISIRLEENEKTEMYDPIKNYQPAEFGYFLIYTQTQIEISYEDLKLVKEFEKIQDIESEKKYLEYEHKEKQQIEKNKRDHTEKTNEIIKQL